MPVKVSVLVAVDNPGPNIDGLVTSLDAQSLAPGLRTPYWELAKAGRRHTDLVDDHLLVSRSTHNVFGWEFLVDHDIHVLDKLVGWSALLARRARWLSLHVKTSRRGISS